MFTILPTFASQVSLYNTGQTLYNLISSSSGVRSISISGSLGITGALTFSGIGGLNIYKSGNNIILFSGGGGGIGGSTTNNYYVNSGSGTYVFRNYISNGVDKQLITFPVLFDTKPIVISNLNNDIDNTIVPYQISGSNTSGFWAIFGDTIPNTGYFLDVWACSSTGTGLATTVIINNIIGGDTSQLSGLLYQTGSNLYNMLTGFSGVFNNSGSQYQSQLNTLTSNLTATGATINNKINALSGFFTGTTGQFYPASNPQAYATSGNLQTTGQQAWTAANNNAINISGNLTSTGAILQNRIVSLSGFFTGNTGQFYPASNPQNYATSGNLQTTGQTVWNNARDNGINLSGNLATTGATLDNKINTLSGYTNNFLVHRIGDESISGFKEFNGGIYTPAIQAAGGGDAIIDIDGKYLYDSSVSLSPTLDWSNRILSGCWTAECLNIISGGGGVESSINNAITGSGTLNYIPKFTSNNSGLINSNIIDSGNTISIFDSTFTIDKNNDNTGINILNTDRSNAVQLFPYRGQTNNPFIIVNSGKKLVQGNLLNFYGYNSSYILLSTSESPTGNGTIFESPRIKFQGVRGNGTTPDFISANIWFEPTYNGGGKLYLYGTSHNLFSWRHENRAAIFNINSLSTEAQLNIGTNWAGKKGLIISGYVGQTANLQEWQGSNGAALSFIDPSGHLTVKNGISGQNITGFNINALGSLKISGQNVLTGNSADLTGLLRNAVYITGSQAISGEKRFYNSIGGVYIHSLDVTSDSLEDQYIDLNSSRLFDATPAPSLNWTTRELINSAGTTTIDWENKLLSGTWNTLGSLKISGHSVITGFDTNLLASAANLTTTGATLNNRIVSLSGQAIGSVILQRDNGTQTAFSPNADTDTARGIALEAAFAAHNTGDTLLVNAGTYTVTSALTLSSGASLIGLGMPILKDMVLTEPLLKIINDNLTIEGLKIVPSSCGVGVYNATPQNISNLILRDLVITPTGVDTNAVMFSEVYNGGNTEHILTSDFYNCVLEGGSSLGYGVFACLSSGEINLWNCDVFGATDGVLLRDTSGTGLAIHNIYGGRYRSTLDAITAGGGSIINVIAARARGDQADLYGDDGKINAYWCDFRDEMAVGNGIQYNTGQCLGSLNLKNGQLTMAALGTPADVGLNRSAASVLKVTDGSTNRGDLEVSDEAYGSSWNGSFEVPTKNAIWDSLSPINHNHNYVTGIRVTGFGNMTGVINFSGLGTVTVLTGTNNSIYFSGSSIGVSSDHGDGINLSGNLTTTGATLNNKINSLSGYNDNFFVHRINNESISGIKTFSSSIVTDGINNSTNASNIHVAFSRLIDENSIISLNWNEKTLIASDEFESINWNNRTLITNAAANSLDWNNRILSGNWKTNDLNVIGNLTISGQSITGGNFYTNNNPSGFITSGEYYRPTQAYNLLIDWRSGNVFSHVYTGSVNFIHTGHRDGQTVVVKTQSTGLSWWSGTWSGSNGVQIKWPGDVVHHQTSGKTDITTFIKVGTGTIYANSVQGFSN